MEFFGQPPEKTAEGHGWKTSLWSHVMVQAPITGRKTLFLATCVEGHVSLEGAKSVEAFFLDKVTNYPSGPPDDLVAFHEWTDITDIDAIKCRNVFTGFIKQYRSIHREIVININLSGKFLGGSLIDAVLSSVSFFHKGLINKYGNAEGFQRRIWDLEKQYIGKRLTYLTP